MALVFMEGNEAVAHGAMAAGCRFFAGYPITPATSVLNHILRLLPPENGICLQGEDEIASIGYCLGAAMAGHKAMTATSGPGMSLYSEQISFAIGSEIPIVIVNVQRLGPSTGSATRGADGDIQFMRWGNSGGLPLIVLAPVDTKDCYGLTIHAFNMAEKFRCPVIIASNKEIAQTRESFDLDSLVLPEIINRTQADPDKPFLPFDAPENTAPPFLPIGGRPLVRQTSSTHGPDGYITIDPNVIEKNLLRLEKKLSASVDDFTLYDYFPAKKTERLIVAYGVTARAVKEVLDTPTFAEGERTSLLVLKTLWPVPERLIKKKADGVKEVLVVEMNLGQYFPEVKRILPDKTVTLFGKMNGSLISTGDIREAIIK